MAARVLRRRVTLAVSIAALIVAGAAGAVVADIIDTGRFLIPEDAVQDEDAYVAATSGRVDGRIEGDLVMVTESLEIAGVVTGDVLVAARGTVAIDGRVDGSVRGVARRIVVRGEIGDDLAVAAPTIDVAGSIGRDVIGLGVSADVAGAVGRDVRGRYVSIEVDGEVSRDVEVTVDEIAIGGNAVVGGDVVYQSVNDIAIAPGATIAGQVIQIPADVPFSVGLVLTIASVVGFLGYVLGGIVLLWLLRSIGVRAVAAITAQPLRTLGIGGAAVVVGPLTLVLAAATLVGIPLAVVTLGMVLAGVFFGSVPLVSAVGTRLLRGRGGIYGGFIVAAVLGRALAALWSPLGVAIYLVAVVWGIGGWLAGSWRARAAAGL